MPVLISDVDYKEYMILQHNSIFQMKIDSVRETKTLKDDIDIPMRNIVAMFALLRCQPVWSCCGFDYDGQPMHKTHEYGDTFIALKDTELCMAIVESLKKINVIVDKADDTSKWEFWKNKLIYLRSDFDYEHRQIQYPWATPSCIHYPELAIMRIQELERALYLFQDYFMNATILSDSNKIQKQFNSYWQYPVLEDWTITKEDIMTLLENK